MTDHQPLTRCGWCGNDPDYVRYHDQQWGVPVHDDRLLFEMLILEGAQAGLSWITVLRKRENYRQAFDDFEPAVVATYTEADVERLLGNAGIIRNRLKIQSAIRNARAFGHLQAEFGSFDQFLWAYVDHRPLQNQWHSLSQIPARTALSDQISQDLKHRGFNFVGSTIVYAYMQATGMVNDHLSDCFRYAELTSLSG